MNGMLYLEGWRLRYIKQLHGCVRGPLLCICLTVETVGRRSNFLRVHTWPVYAQLGPLQLEHLLAVQLRSNKRKMLSSICPNRVVHGIRSLVSAFEFSRLSSYLVLIQDLHPTLAISLSSNSEGTALILRSDFEIWENPSQS
jgi:hypothetical protein